MEYLEELSRNEKLSPDALLFIISKLESKSICASVKMKLMTCLIPEQFIPEEAFIRMTCLLCDFKLDVDLKVEILKWMITVYSFLDNLTNFENLIEVFFQLLECEKLIPYICQLLLKMARPGLVTADRYHRLTDLFEKFNSVKDMNPLIFTYCRILSGGTFEPKKDFEVNLDVRGIYPSLIKKFHPSFDTFNPVYHIVNNDENEPLPPYSIRVEKGTQPVSLPTNDKFLYVQPGEQNEFLEIYKEFERLKKQKLCNVLQSKYRRLFLTSDISKAKEVSIQDFILESMCRNLKNMDFLHESLEIFFEMQKLVPRICFCTEKIIEQWDGSSGLSIILGMLLYEPLCCFEKFQYSLDIICEKITNSSFFIQCDVLNGLSNLYREWVLRRHSSDMSCDFCIHNRSMSDKASTSSDDQLILNQIHKLGNYIITMSDEFLLKANFHICLLNEILIHNERVSRSHLLVDNLVLHPPSTIAFHGALFSRNPIILESLCRLILRYLEELKHMKKNKHPEYQLADIYIKRYNNDIYLLLLRGKYESRIVTHLTRENIIPQLISAQPNFEEYFEVFRHPAFIQKTARFVANIHMNVSFADIKNNAKVRDSYFSFLEEDGQKFVVKFLKWLIIRERK